MFFISWDIQHNEQGHSYGKLVIGNFITTTHPLMHHVFAECFGETSNHPGDSASQQPRFGALRLLPFPKTKITFEREEISDCQWDSGKYNGRVHGDSNKGFCRVFWTVEEMLGELCEAPTWRGWRHHCPVYNVFCIFFNKCLCFTVHGWILSGQNLYSWIYQPA